MMKKKLLAVSLVLALALALFAGCGGSADTPDGDPAGDSGDAGTAANAGAGDGGASGDAPEALGGQEPTIYRLADVEATQLMDPDAAANVQTVSITPVDTGGRPLRIGYSQMEVNNTWRIVMNDSMETAITGAGWEFIYRDAQSSIEKQNRDITELINEGCDFIVISPYEYEGLGPALAEARAAGIPVILADREAAGTAGEDYVTAILGDFVDVGYKCAQSLRNEFGPGEHIRVVEITGTAGASIVRELSAGFRMFMEEDGNMEIVTSADGNFGRAESLTAMENIVQAYGGEFDAVFCHVDDAAIAAIQALNEAGYTPGVDWAAGEIPITSMCGYTEAFDAILDGDMLSTVECTARFGPAIVDIIERLQEGGEVATRLVMPCMVYDRSNCAELYADSLA